MPLSSRRIYDSETGLTETVEGGRRLRAKWRVNTGDEFTALTAPGVPAMGAAHGTDPTLVVVSRTPRREGGTDNGSGLNAVTTVFVEYAQRNYQWSGEVKEVQPAGVKHTVISIVQESVEIGYGLYTTGPNKNKPKESGPLINNGRGSTKKAGRVTAEVYDFRPTTYNVPVNTLIDYASDPKLNDAPLVLPAPLGTTDTITMPAGTVLYVGFRVEARPDAKLIVHQLELAKTFDLFWAIPSADGQIVGTGFATIYPSISLAGLW